MIRDSRKGKPGFFGTRGVAHEVIGPVLLRHEFVAKFKHASLRCRIHWGSISPLPRFNEDMQGWFRPTSRSSIATLRAPWCNFQERGKQGHVYR